MYCDICYNFATQANQCPLCKYVQCINCTTSSNCCLMCLRKFSPQSDDHTSIMSKLVHDPTNNRLVSTEKIALPNLGNSCYVNAIIQIFLHSQVLWSSILDTFKADNLLTSLRSKYCEFANIPVYEQCDSMLFLTWLLDNCSEHKQSWEQVWRTNLECTKCSKKTHCRTQSENLWIVYPNTDDAQFDMESCVKAQLQEEGIPKNCDHCKENTKHTLRSSLLNLPKNLFINLQHFAGKCFNFYDEICVDVYNNLTEDEDFAPYVLKGFVMHTGSQSAGHYTTFCLDKDGWTQYDDDTIHRKLDLPTIIMQQSANVTIPLLWYERV